MGARVFLGAENVQVEVEKYVPAPPQNLCPDGSVGCQEPAPTMVIVIAGLCVMLFLIAVALVLLFYSYYKYRRQNSADAELNLSATADVLEGDGNSYDDALLVLMPGEEEPVYFARPSPLDDDASEVIQQVLEQLLDFAVRHAPCTAAENREINRIVEQLVLEVEDFG